jgi:hypothetical protein
MLRVGALRALAVARIGVVGSTEAAEEHLHGLTGMGTFPNLEVTGTI